MSQTHLGPRPTIYLPPSWSTKIFLSAGSTQAGGVLHIVRVDHIRTLFLNDEWRFVASLRWKRLKKWCLSPTADARYMLLFEQTTVSGFKPIQGLDIFPTWSA